MMTRRTLNHTLVAGATAVLVSGTASAQDLPLARNVMLVHGLFADGSCWSAVIPRLQTAGLNVTSVQNPLTTFEDAVASTQRVLARQEGPTVLVGHSFSGMIVGEVGVDPKVSALVYVAARAPDAGEDYAALAKTYPTPPASAGIVFDGDEGRLSEAAFLKDFAGDLPAEEARVLFAVQQPFRRALLTGENHPGGLAVEAELLRGVDRGSHHRSGPRTFHGSAHEREDRGAQGQPPLADLSAAGYRRPHP